MCSVQQICFLAFAAAAAAGSSLAGQCDSELSDSAALLQTNIAGRPEAGEDRGPAEEDSALASKMQWDDQHCACTTVFLAAVLDTGTNAVHHEDHRMGGFSFFQRYYESIIALPGGRAKAVIIHNRLPENLTRAKSNSAVSFTKVDISGMHEHMTVVEWRWIVLFDQVRKHPEWDTLFMTDISDVVVHHNPCVFVQKHPGKLFASSEQNKGFGGWVLHSFFRQLGGKYLAWYGDHRASLPAKLLNAGVFGGHRADVLRFAVHMEAVLLDPELAIKKDATTHWFDPGAFNYALRAKFALSDVVSGYPLHSWFWKYERRKDVYIKHK